MSETDRRLKDHLNTHQVNRERMCLELLRVQPDYSDVEPRLPKGGPDGGRDLQGYYKEELCFGAVGFVNDATDTNQHRDQIRKKFQDDLKSALEVRSGSDKPKVFVFFTNVCLTPDIINELKLIAVKSGCNHCEIFDRERLRIILDSNRGYAIRLRYLDIPLSDAEQKDFFSAWADQINAVIGSGLTGIDQTTKRIQFLLEAQFPLNSLTTIVKLNTSIWDACKGEFFFQTNLHLRSESNGLLNVIFGGGTKEIKETLDEWKANGEPRTTNSQYGFCYSTLVIDSPQHQLFCSHVNEMEGRQNQTKGGPIQEFRTINSISNLPFDSKIMSFEGLSEPFLFRYTPTCSLVDLDQCLILFECNKEISHHIEEIVIVGGGYELLKILRADFKSFDGDYNRLAIPIEGKQKSESHAWTTLRPPNFVSVFSIDLFGKTPKRYDW